MRLNELRQQYRDEILSAASRNGVRYVRVFGSVARGDARPDSDIDLLVDLESADYDYRPRRSSYGR